MKSERSSGELKVHLLSPCVLLMNGLAFSLLFPLSTLLLVLSHLLLLLGLSYHDCLCGHVISQNRASLQLTLNWTQSTKIGFQSSSFLTKHCNYHNSECLILLLKLFNFITKKTPNKMAEKKVREKA